MDENFSNAPIQISDLPAVQNEAFTPLHTEYRSLRLVSRAIFFSLVAAVGVLVYFSTELKIWHIYLPFAIVVVYTFWVEIAGFKRKGYLIRERDISYRSGLLFHHVTTVPVVRIQHSEVSQSFLQRLFDLATVKIYTAGGSGSDVSIPGLHPEEAHKVRDYINQTVHANES